MCVGSAEQRDHQREEQKAQKVAAHEAQARRANTDAETHRGNTMVKQMPDTCFIGRGPWLDSKPQMSVELFFLGTHT